MYSICTVFCNEIAKIVWNGILSAKHWLVQVEKTLLLAFFPDCVQVFAFFHLLKAKN